MATLDEVQRKDRLRRAKERAGVAAATGIPAVAGAAKTAATAAGVGARVLGVGAEQVASKVAPAAASAGGAMIQAGRTAASTGTSLARRPIAPQQSFGGGTSGRGGATGSWGSPAAQAPSPAPRPQPPMAAAVGAAATGAAPSPAAAPAQNDYWSAAGYPSEMAYKQKVQEIRTRQNLQKAALNRTPGGTPGREDIVLGMTEGRGELQALQQVRNPIDRLLSEEEHAAKRAKLNSDAARVLEQQRNSIQDPADQTTAFVEAGRAAQGRRPVPGTSPATEAFLTAGDAQIGGERQVMPDGSISNAGSQALARERARVNQLRAEAQARLAQVQTDGIAFNGTPADMVAGQQERIARQTRERDEAAAVARAPAERREIERVRARELARAQAERDQAMVEEETRMAREGPRMTSQDRLNSAQADAEIVRANTERSRAESEAAMQKRQSQAFERSLQDAAPILTNPSSIVDRVRPILESMKPAFGSLLGAQQDDLFQPRTEDISELRSQAVDPILAAVRLDPTRAAEAARLLLAALPPRGSDGLYGSQRPFFGDRFEAAKAKEDAENLNQIVDDLNYVIAAARKQE